MPEPPPFTQTYLVSLATDGDVAAGEIEALLVALGYHQVQVLTCAPDHEHPCPTVSSSGGMALTEDVVAALVAEAEAGYDPARLVPRRVNLAAPAREASMPLSMPDWPVPCDVCGRLRRLADLAVAWRPLAVAEDRFPEIRFHVCHCPDRWLCIAYAGMPGPWRGRPVPAIEAPRHLSDPSRP